MINSIKMYLIVGLGSLLLLGALYGYWSYSQKTIIKLSSENVLLRDTLKANKEALASIQQSFAASARKLEELNKKYAQQDQESNDRKSELDKSLELADQDLTKIEQTFNQAYNNTLDRMKVASENLSLGTSEVLPSK